MKTIECRLCGRNFRLSEIRYESETGRMLDTAYGLRPVPDLRAWVECPYCGAEIEISPEILEDETGFVR